MKKIIVVIVAALAATSAACAIPSPRAQVVAAPFGCTETAPAPGTTCALLRYKQPYLFPTDAGVDKSRPATPSKLPVAGTTEAYLFYKNPAVYGPRSETAAAREPIGFYPAQGTPEWFRCYKLGDCRKPESR